MNKLNKFSIITATLSDNGIGYNNTLPWRYFKEDMQFFKEKTTNNTVIMGFNTFKSLNFNPLKNRMNIVIDKTITKTQTNPYNNHIICNSLDDALKKKPKGEIFVIGGASIYNKAIKHPYCDKIYITTLKHSLPSDRFFPKIDLDKFYLAKTHQKGTSMIKLMNYSTKELEYEIKEYQRTNFMFVDIDNILDGHNIDKINGALKF